MGRGDVLARGARSASFPQGGAHRDEPIELRNVAAEEPESAVPSVVDNSALFAKPKPAIYYEGTPLNDRVLIRRVERTSNSSIILPDAVKGKSDMGEVVSIGDGVLGIAAGDLVLFDKYAAVGQEVNLLDASGDEREHLIVQKHDIILKLKVVENEQPKGCLQ